MHPLNSKTSTATWLQTRLLTTTTTPHFRLVKPSRAPLAMSILSNHNTCTGHKLDNCLVLKLTMEQSATLFCVVHDGVCTCFTESSFSTVTVPTTSRHEREEHKKKTKARGVTNSIKTHNVSSKVHLHKKPAGYAVRETTLFAQLTGQNIKPTQHTVCFTGPGQDYYCSKLQHLAHSCSMWD